MTSHSRNKSLADLIVILRPEKMVEFGSWEGASAIVFLETAKDSSLKLRLICVDTWLGSQEHWNNDLPNSDWSFERLRVVNGEPLVIDTFRQNIEAAGFLQDIGIVRAPVVHAGGYLRDTYGEVDLVYIDADHSFSSVREDLKVAEEIIADKGMIAGDDWGWPTVRLSVALSCAFRRQIIASPDGTTYLLYKKSLRPVADEFLNEGWSKKAGTSVLIDTTLEILIRFGLRRFRDAKIAVWHFSKRYLGRGSRMK